MASGNGGSVNDIGAQIEGILDRIADADPAVRDLAEDLVHTLMRFYGTGLGRIVELADEPLVAKLAADEVVGGLLVLHDLHPASTLDRVTAALEEVRPYLGSHAGDVELIGLEDGGVLRLALKGTCDGCPSSTVTLKYAIEKSIMEATPEITAIEVSGVVEEPAAPPGRTLLPLEAVECPVPR
jgi:Fe-S cluster biogenesis protein NfuA